MAFIPHIALFKRHKFKIFFGIVIFWLLIGFFVYITEVIAHYYFETKALDAVEQQQYFLRWILWLLLTPLIILSALKINIGNCRLFWFVIIHIILGTLLLAVEFSIEVAIIKPLAEHFYLRRVDIGEIIIPFLFKYFGYIIMYFLIVGIVNIFVHMHSLQAAQQKLLETKLRNKDLEYQLALSELQTLKMQIHPHFLFNTHHSIISLIVKKENDKAAQMLSKLSELLRMTIEKQETELVMLADEIKSADLYLDIQKIRFSDRFTYKRDISAEAENVLVPYFILQPIVENAVLYGVEKTDSNAEIAIRGFVENKELHVEITNTGNLAAPHASIGLGIGLSNVKKRLQQYYGEKATFKLVQETGNTTVAKIKIPV